MPTPLAQVAALVEATEGVHYTDLVTHLTDPATADQALTDLLHHATTLDPNPAPDIEGHLAQWGPVIDAIVAAATTGHTPPELTQGLDQLAGTSDWTHLTAAIRAVLTGDRNHEPLLAGLDPVDTAILNRLTPPAGPTPARQTGDDQP